VRPSSHREQIPEQRCGNCRLAHLVRREHLLCFHGDNVSTRKWDYGTDVILNSQDVDLLEGDEFDELWAGRVVEPSDVCDEWEDCDP
jgi:hypothetical protein